MAKTAISTGMFAKLMWPGILSEYGENWRFATRPDDAEDSTDPWLVTETLYRAEYPADDWPPDEARDFMVWFKAKLAKIPAAWRGSAKIKFETDGGYDEPSTVLSITYDRDETPAEIAERRALYAGKVKLWQERQSREEEAQRAEFERLKAKFEGE